MNFSGLPVVGPYLKRRRCSRTNLLKTISFVTILLAISLFIATLATTKISILASVENSPAKSVMPTITVLTFASHNVDFLCNLLYTAVINQLPVKVIGFHGRTKDVLFKKIPVTLEELRRRDPDEIILFVDAYDVILADTGPEIIAKFLATKEKVIFTAEKGCWPFMDGRADGEKVCLEEYPQSPTPYRFLNSGGWIGYAGAAITLFEEMMALPEAAEKAIDQELASLVFLRGRSRFGLDYDASIFQSVHMSYTDLKVVSDKESGSHFRRWQNTITGAFPAVMHFNGNGKEHQHHVEKGMGLSFDQATLDTLKADGKLPLSGEQLIQGLSYDKECPRK